MLRHVALGLTAVACLLLIVAEFGDLNQIEILTVTRDGVGVGSHHGYAQLIIALVAAAMAYGAWRGSLPAAVAVVALGAVSLFIVLVIDLPDVDATGLYGRDYEQASSSGSLGFRLEAAGAVLLLFAGGLTAFARSVRAPTRREAAPEGR